MKKFLSGLMIALIFVPCIICLGGCNQQEMCTKPKKITDYLYEISYTDYRQDTNFETIEKAEAFGCSSVRNGNFYGRNFDYIYNDVPEFVVKMSATQNRHASIGIATHFGLREANINSYDKQLELIPNFTLDGINDCGVICSHNVVKIEQDNLNLTGTNPNGEDLHMLFIPRFVLDNASSADEAIRLIKSRNIIGNLNNVDYLHIMVADKNKTYVVEFYKNGVIVEEKLNDNRIMTNYYLNLPTINEHAMGVERFNILKENYNLGSTFEGMQQLMQKVKYSLAYKAESAWYSEILTQTEINNPEKETIFFEKGSIVAEEYQNAIQNNERANADSRFWQTVHNSTYDMENKKLTVFVQEDYAHSYEFAL